MNTTEQTTDFTKIVRIGKTEDVGSVYCEIKFMDGRLSITGVEGPMRNGDCRGGAGQIDMHLDPAQIVEFADGWNAEIMQRFLDIWHEWHLNDMRAGCKHQRENWDLDAMLTVTRYTWGIEYHNLRRRIERGTNPEASAADGEELARINAVFEVIDLHGHTTNGQHTWPYDAHILFENGFIKEKDTEDKRAGWVYEKEHPAGCLAKPCEVCGHKYGSSWLREDVPADVLAFLRGLPDTDIEPAWV